MSDGIKFMFLDKISVPVTFNKNSHGIYEVRRNFATKSLQMN